MDRFKVQTLEELDEYKDKAKKQLLSQAQLSTSRNVKFACNLEIDFGHLDLGHLVGKIPMYSHDPKPSFEHLDEAEEMLKEIIKDSKMWLTKERLTGENNIVRSCLIMAMYAHPTEDPRSQYVIVLAACIVASFYMDDEMCGEILFSTVNEIDLDDMCEIITNVLKGKYTAFEQIPGVPAMYEGIARLFFMVIQKYGSLIPPEVNSDHIKEAFQASVQSMMMLRIPRVGQACSKELYQRLRGRDCGMVLSMQMFHIALNHGAVDERVRKHIVYQRLLDLCGEEAGIANDTVQFIKEMKGDDVYYNYVLRGVEMDGNTFEKSFRKAIKLITKLRKDIHILFEQLLEEFPDDHSLEEYMILVKNMLDANVYASAVSPRYAGMKTRELPYEE